VSVAVVPAAGSASRFGGGKLFALVDGVPLLDRTLGALLQAGIDRVIVVTPSDPDWGAVVRGLSNARVQRVVNADPSRGMFSSIQIGVREADSGPIAILPGDMPFVRVETVARVLHTAVETGAMVSPRFEGRRGHPIMLPFDLREAVVHAPASAMLNEVLRPYRDRIVNVDVEDRGVVRDVDVQADLGDGARDLQVPGGPGGPGVPGGPRRR
jgi:molybdenum cofactor cytidylyltransferase